MRKLREWIVRVGGLFNKQRKDRELDEEIESNLQLHIEDNLRLGMTPEEAERILREETFIDAAEVNRLMEELDRAEETQDGHFSLDATVSEPRGTRRAQRFHGDVLFPQ